MEEGEDRNHGNTLVVHNVFASLAGARSIYGLRRPKTKRLEKVIAGKAKKKQN